MKPIYMSISGMMFFIIAQQFDMLKDSACHSAEDEIAIQGRVGEGKEEEGG